MEKRRVLAVRMLAGVQFKADVLKNLNAQPEPGSSQKHAAEMELHPAGVLAIHQGAHLLIPYSNISFVQLDPVAAPMSDRGANQKGAK